jgi:carbon monoxide dehydrogenase subunit G
MEIEKLVQLKATPEDIWNFILDPALIAPCVPGVQSVEVISPDEYLSVIKVKISFVSASFKIRTTITSRELASRLLCVGQGEDAALASKLKHQTEIMLTPQAGGLTDLRITSQVDVLGRVGSFGLSAMKTKVDRMWDEFSVALKDKLDATVSDR